ncbi:(2Fe-2S)-binding protein [Methylomonas paludis]|uniref:(2Fe-2S)-binding protein n=1 Tax=Methylomonas paludis TaxID=1173101 RepID=A0A975MPI7_9GAMM|nr:(2Fe-2S)-binding protein [Methylomonas paludis]QWF71109.1 (2Fe-2S)-binding protein [Methylomonas paludis]
MNQTPSEAKPKPICPCSGTSVAQIKALIGEGIVNLDRISRITGACSGCGGCEAEILALLAEYNHSQIAEATAHP